MKIKLDDLSNQYINESSKLNVLVESTNNEIKQQINNTIIYCDNITKSANANAKDIIDSAKAEAANIIKDIDVEKDNLVKVKKDNNLILESADKKLKEAQTLESNWEAKLALALNKLDEFFKLEEEFNKKVSDFEQYKIDTELNIKQRSEWLDSKQYQLDYDRAMFDKERKDFLLRTINK